MSAGELQAIYDALRGPKHLITVPSAGHSVLLPRTPAGQQEVDAFLRAAE